jgi:4-amino-4-deoxy-L-arabinose transferase-like glycosyltransferase
MVAGLALISLWIADREASWAKRLGWGWGLMLVILVVGPWAAAITVDTDGGFWTGAVKGDLAPKLMGGHETHGAPPGLHALLLPLLMFPATFLLPAAALAAWRRRKEAGVRFALAWLLPSWIVFEALPTKLVHYTLPLYGAVAWLMATALVDPSRSPLGPRVRWIGAGLSLLAGLAFAAAAAFVVWRYPNMGAAPLACLGGALAVAAALVGAWGLLRGDPQNGLLGAAALGVLAHVAITAGLAPRISAFWTSSRAAERVAADHLDPRNGVITGPVAVVGYAEPSLVFALGTGTELAPPANAAESVAEGQPALVEKRQDAAFRAALASAGVPARPVDEIKGYDYSTGKAVDLTLWRSEAPSTETAR